MYQVLVHNPFNIADKDTYLPVIIRLKTRTHFNHTAVLYKDEDGEWYIIHAVKPKVKRVKYTEWLQQVDRSTITVPLESNYSEEELIERAKAQVGKDYDTLGLLQIDVDMTFGIWLGKKDDYSKHMCYKLVAYIAGKKDAYREKPKYKINTI